MITSKIDGLVAFQAKLDGVAKDTGVAMMRSVNRAIRGARTDASVAIRRQVALKKSYVDGKLRLILARSPADPVAEIRAERRGVLLSRFPHTQRTARSKAGGRKPAGIRVAVKPGNRKLLASAFLVPLRRGKEDGAGGLGIARRLPGAARDFEVLHGPSVSQVFNTVRDDIAPAVLVRYRREFDRQLQMVLKK